MIQNRQNAPSHKPPVEKVYLLDQDGRPLLLAGKPIEVSGHDGSPHLVKFEFAKGERK